MTIAAIARCCRSAWSAPACLSLVVLAAVMSSIASAQAPVPAGKASPAVTHGDPGKGKRGALTVEVLLVDPDGKQQHAAKALVRIEGAEDSQETNEKGRARLSGISTGTVTLQIMPVGLNICRLVDVPVTGPDQLVSILVEKSPPSKCTRRE